ncbi:MAG TPA: serpin family protein [Streptosporangiaceae bacterium]|nr:serpin family protein [Streptosporangiaceae bacterium]
MKRTRQAGRLATGAAAIAAVGTLATGCGSRPAPQPRGAEVIRGVAAVEPAVSPRPYAAADLAFGLDVLGAWCRQKPTQNIVLSPSSLASGLGMAYLGAGGSTAAAMASVLHLPAARSGTGGSAAPGSATPGSIEAGLQARSRALASLSGPGVSVAGSDRVWADPKLLPRRSYLDAVATGYGAGIGRVPLLSNPDQATKQIDAAIAAATRGHITHLLSAQAVQGSIFVLTDALYMKARWATPFSPGQTTTGSFLTAAGQRVQAHYLNGSEFNSASANGWTAVSLPYQGGKLSMTALLPPAPSSSQISSCPEISTTTLAALTSELSAPGAGVSSLSLPEISLRTQADLMPLLTKLGMGVAFGGAADFSGMSLQAGSLGEVEHAATLRVDAAGTVASAATAVVVLPSSARVTGPPVVFNRPYLLLVSAASTGEPLFLARVANPEAS